MTTMTLNTDTWIENKKHKQIKLCLWIVIFGLFVSGVTAFPILEEIDWLAFAHIMLTLLFIGILKNPLKNIWVIEFGIICCVLTWPLTLICGHIREIPFLHQLVDCSFGLMAIVPLYLARKWTLQGVDEVVN